MIPLIVGLLLPDSLNFKWWKKTPATIRRMPERRSGPRDGRFTATLYRDGRVRTFADIDQRELDEIMAHGWERL